MALLAGSVLLNLLARLFLEGETCRPFEVVLNMPGRGTRQYTRLRGIAEPVGKS